MESFSVAWGHPGRKTVGITPVPSRSGVRAAVPAPKPTQPGAGKSKSAGKAGGSKGAAKAGGKDEKPVERVVAENRKARHEYEIIDTLECGIALVGTTRLAADRHIAIQTIFGAQQDHFPDDLVHAGGRRWKNRCRPRMPKW